LTKEPVLLVAAGGIYDGRGLAASLMLGASAVWVGTRFVVAKESGAPRDAKKAIIDAGIDSTIKSTIWSGRPLRALKTDYIARWETERRAEKEELQAKGILPVYHDIEVLEQEGKWTEEMEDQSTVR
jgi:NAD(P)H-dependent flavin oxidoreductase YrpB (nitropropane dioxygenase family)